jgi:hypothetical protein
MNIEQITKEYLSSFFGQDLNECVDSLTEEHIAEAIASINLLAKALNEQFRTVGSTLTPIVGPELLRQKPQTVNQQLEVQKRLGVLTGQGSEWDRDQQQEPQFISHRDATAQSWKEDDRVGRSRKRQRKIENDYIQSDDFDPESRKKALDAIGDSAARTAAARLRGTDYRFGDDGDPLPRNFGDDGPPVNPLDYLKGFGRHRTRSGEYNTFGDRPSSKYFRLTADQEAEVERERESAKTRAVRGRADHVWDTKVMPLEVEREVAKEKARYDKEYKEKFGDHLDRTTVAQNRLDLHNKIIDSGRSSAMSSSEAEELRREISGRNRLKSVGMDPNTQNWDDSATQLKAFGEIERRERNNKAREATMRDVQRDMMAYEQFIGYFTEQVGMYPRRTGAEISRESGWDRLAVDRQIRAGRAEARREAGSLANNPAFQGIDTNDAAAVQGRADQIMQGVQDRTRRGRSDEQIAADREAARQARIDSRPVRAVRKLEKDMHSDNVRMELTNRSRARRGLAPLPVSRFYNLKAPRTLDFHGDEIQQYADMSPAERWSRRNGTFSPRPEPQPQPQPQSEEEFMGPSEEEYMKSIFPEKTVDARSLPGGEDAPEGATTTWSGDSGYSTLSPPPSFTTQGIINNAINRARQNGFRSTGSTPPVM